MNRREFIKTFAAGSAIASFPFALKLAEVPKEIYVAEIAKTEVLGKTEFVFDPSNAYGNMVLLSEDLKGNAFDEALKVVIDNAREIVPKGYKIQVLYNQDPMGKSFDPFNEYCSLAWKYSPYPFFDSPYALGVITL